MTIKYNNVYVLDASTVAGYYESFSPYKKYFDKVYKNDFYFNEKSLEKAEIKLFKESIEILLNKCNLKKEDIDVLIGGDLLNQIASSCYGAKDFNIPFLGVYTACATTGEEILIASNLIENGSAKRVICTTSSHNLSSEKQFRNPVEYGGPKPKTATFTATGGASILLTNEKTNIKVESITIGKINDLNQKDANHMGAVMTPGAADTINTHLKDLNRDINYYDLILTGDLGIFGKEILKEYMEKEYKIKLKKNYSDCGAMLYDLNSQKEITAGGSGPVCSALINYGYILKMLKEKKLSRVLLVPTGALFSPTMLYQKENILSIAYAISLEVVK